MHAGSPVAAPSLCDVMCSSFLLLTRRLITLNSMKAADEITEEQSRQMLFDIENAYAEFFRSLSSSG
jgi:hypothetical protein